MGFISQYVDLQQRGDEFWGLSPFKTEKTPSFSVRPSPPCFFDYSSGIGGNIYTFIKHYFHCSSSEAVRILEEYTGQTDTTTGERKRVEKLDATLVCNRFKPNKKPQKESKATILPDDYMSKYEKRDDKLKVWRSEGISDASLEKFQVFYDGFSNRLVYPIKNIDGKIVNVGGRTLDPRWKEKRLKKYCYFFSWGVLDIIYGLYENLEAIKKQQEIILFEGAKSVMLADGWGIHNTGAILTSHLNPSQMMLLAKLGCRVVFALDKDVDITQDFNIKKLEYYVNVEYIFDRDNLLQPKDSPVDQGEAVFRKLLSERRRL